MSETVTGLVPGEALHGRNRISARAIRSVVTAIAATELHTPANTVGIDLADDAGALALTVSAPIGVASLTRVTGAQRASSRTVLERAAAAQETIRTRVLELTGSTIGTVNLRLTAARIAVDERVR
jgi:hypothetical protein